MVVMMPLKPAQLKLSPLGGAVFHISDQKSTTKFIFQLRLFIYMLITERMLPHRRPMPFCRGFPFVISIGVPSAVCADMPKSVTQY